MRHKSRSERGATLVEMAFVAPLALLLLFGVIEFSRLLYTYSQVWTAAREGARYATTVGDTDGDGTPNYLDCDGILDAAVAKAIGLGIRDDQIDVTIVSDTNTADCDPLTATPNPVDIDVDNGAIVTIDVDYQFDAATPILSGFLDGTPVNSQQSRSLFKGIVGS